MYRIGATVLLLAAIVPFLRSASSFVESAILPIQPVEGGPIPRDAITRTRPDLSKRSDSPTDVCFRWAQQSALVNGTLYLYGGEASAESGQTDDLWNNDFLTLDLTKTWDIASPSLTGLSQPSGPPAVALGYLWNSYDSLYLYGGEFSWKPVTTPTAFSLWEYSIASQSWIEHTNPTTSSGDNAPSNGDSVQRAAEGAGISVPSLGRGFYFGGHQDGYTTEGWSQSIYRIYLQSLLEFTFPGYTNDQVYTLDSGTTAGTDGNYRNITVGGLQSSAGFTERADGVLIYVPGFGEQGILLALAGGTNTTYTQMNNIDVYDIANSTWYKQSTSGSVPNIRVNPCAVMAAAPDGSSYNIYMFGGQSLQPAGAQNEYEDMWILTLPSFTWIEVDQSNQSVPYGRSGHTCNVWDGQMIVVGGYVGTELSCETPGIYVFDMSNLQWVQQFTALSPGTDTGSSDSTSSSSSSGASASASSGSGSTGTATAKGSSSTSSASSDFNSTGSNNPLNQQPAQLANGTSPGGMEGSYGYTVPQVVIDIIGGNASGGATVTAPVETATGGPLATGKPITYTVTQPNGATVTETSTPGSGTGTSTSSSGGGGGPNIAAIVVGVICGILFFVVCYLAFCAYVYRKQLQLYKQHVEMSQRQARGEKVPAIPGLLGTDSPKSSSDRARLGAQPAWVQSESASQRTGGAYSGGQTSSSGPGAASGNTSGGSAGGYQSVRRESDQSSTNDLMDGHEPTFVGVLLNPRRSLRVVNRD
ncbi:hypothetical protein LTR36_003705 [Oleoguttula mirabilis]|uniref:Kelch repeat-containing protein n=1 Tax=Oleoguttula mirabilis TaxID=1507867 RepID=A0AAV9JJL8_9PEZI|nr:hypothetical protein LTR36_003705 [Oleoguttula mirabilis]